MRMKFTLSLIFSTRKLIKHFPYIRKIGEKYPCSGKHWFSIFCNQWMLNNYLTSVYISAYLSPMRAVLFVKYANVRIFKKCWLHILKYGWCIPNSSIQALFIWMKWFRIWTSFTPTMEVWPLHLWMKLWSGLFLVNHCMYQVRVSRTIVSTFIRTYQHFQSVKSC